jgi:hypothetical protein
MRAMTQNDDPAASPLRQGALAQMIHDVDRAAKARRAQSEILEFIQEALVTAEEPGSISLSGDVAAHIAESKSIVNEVVLDIDSLLKCIGDLGLRNELVETFNDALLHAYILGNYSTPPEAIWQLFRKQHEVKQAAKAREARADAPEELALIEAIRTKTGGEPIKRPMKEARAILDGVNAELASAGFEPVSVYTIYRRLEKRVRS